MTESLQKFKDRFRITIILYVFADPVTETNSEIYGEFRTEIKIQAIDFLLRYPDFFANELMKLLDENAMINPNEVMQIVEGIFTDSEPEIRTEEMQKFFHGAYESIDDAIAFLVSIGFIKYISRRRVDGKEFDKIYQVTHFGKQKIEENLKSLSSVKWYYDRCSLIKKYFGAFSGSELKDRQYKYQEEYADIPYKSKIGRVQEKVKTTFLSKFNKELL